MVHSIKDFKKFAVSNRRRRDVVYEIAFGERLTELAIRHKRQAIIGYYIVDFLLADRLLIIEVDEQYHLNRHHQDSKRQRYLEAWGFQFLRVNWTDSFADAVNAILQYPASRDNRRRCRSIIARANARSKHPPLEAAGGEVTVTAYVDRPITIDIPESLKRHSKA